eukprot:CAMPEP_0117436418 /NCGR_PEP_ID=MMETSP0759-20121206/996_1 /TAXON_ID=63605 /ORGANISM="Percolomonas cosmopolitus, Strain WS" /LENGTH=1161 /DNA_ID=CAMNT_0005228015 /DNA_START=84 /DNA_END=3569 /DNA_ORIENTATION=+
MSSSQPSSSSNPMSTTQSHKKFQHARAGQKFQKKKLVHHKKHGIEERRDHWKRELPKQKDVRMVQRQVNKAQLGAHAEDLHDIPRLRVNRNYYSDPPKVVVVAGGKGSGKSTIIKSLVKHYTRRKLDSVDGPITVKAGKSRLTFFETQADSLTSLIDIAKIADIVLLTIDVSFGFQMETFEFLNLLQVHGFPRIMGVMTHLDSFKNIEKMKTCRREIKKRFREEVSESAKLFYLSGIRDEYFTPRDVSNLARFISTKKTKPLSWRSAHPSILADRVEDVTHPSQIQDNPHASRHVSFYGWVRGTNFKSTGLQFVHIPGAGDYQISSITSLNDPLPANTKKATKNSMEKQRGLYAPMLTTENLTFTQDSVYIEVNNAEDLFAEANRAQRKSRQVHLDNNELAMEREQQQLLLAELHDNKMHLDEAVQQREISLLSNGKALKAVNDGDRSSFNNGNSHHRTVARPNTTPATSHSAADRMTDDFDEQEMGEHYATWKDQMQEKAKSKFLEKSISLHSLVYESQDLLDDFEALIDSKANVGSLLRQQQDNEIDSLFSKLSSSKSTKKPSVQNDQYLAKLQLEKDDIVHDWSEQDMVESIRDMFVTGDWSKRNGGDSEEESDDDKSDNEDPAERSDSDDAQMKDANSDSEEDEEILRSMRALKDDDISVSGDDSDMDDDALEKERIKKKEAFDATYDKGELKPDEEDAAVGATGGPEFKSVHEFIMHEKAMKENPQDKINRTEFQNVNKDLRERVEGISPGTYVRIEIKEIPSEFVDHLTVSEPIILGGLKPEEMQQGMIKLKIKRHRWFPKTLKNKDPLIFSIGWRRFQSIPMYFVQDPNGRQRLIKYTLDHMHCMASIFGPFVPQNTGVVAFQSLDSDQQHFRIAATGFTMETDQKVEIVKKLKLIGYPKNIKKNTCFITQMFTSDLEVAKFQGAKLRTVSGLRGRVKKAVRDDAPGDFRATFEDKLLPSDIVFLRTWYPIEEIKFYNPVLNRLTKEWVRMRTVGELRHIRGLKAPVKADSNYKSIKERNTEGHDVDLKVKAKTAVALPFAHQRKKETNVTGVTTDLTKVVSHVEESATKRLLNALKSDDEKQRENLISRMESIDADRRLKNSKQDVKRELKRLKEVTHEERMLRKRKRLSEKERYMKAQLNRAKRAKFSIGEK